MMSLAAGASMVTLAFISAAMTAMMSCGVAAADPTTPIADIELSISESPAATIRGDSFMETTMDIAVILDRDHCDFTNPRLLEMAKALNLTILRVGGTEGDFLYYDLTSNADPAPAPPAPFTRSVSGAMLRRAFSFVTDGLGIDFVFGLNTGRGPRGMFENSSAVKPWQPFQARTFIRWLIENNITSMAAAATEEDAASHSRRKVAGGAKKSQLIGFEFGNEPNLFPFNSNTTIPGSQFAADLITFNALLEKEQQGGGHKWVTTCCDAAYMPVIGESWDFMKEFAAANGTQRVDYITWHFYPLLGGHFPAKDDPLKATPEKLFEPIVLDQVGSWADHLQSVVANGGGGERPPLILGETGSAVGGGQQGVSDRYCDIVEYIDKAGQMAVRGQARVWRQTLCGSPDQYYGLISHDLNPRPSYFAMLLFRKLLQQNGAGGWNVHSVTATPWLLLGTIRAYVFRKPTSSVASSSSVAILINLNANPLVNVSVQWPQHPWCSSPGTTVADVYELTPAGDGAINATSVNLNGIEMTVAANGAPTALIPQRVSLACANTTVVVPSVSARAVTFIHFL